MNGRDAAIERGQLAAICACTIGKIGVGYLAVPHDSAQRVLAGAAVPRPDAGGASLLGISCRQLAQIAPL